MVFMYVYVLSIPLFSQNVHNTHLSMKVIFQTKEKSEYCSAIIDNRSYAPICVLEEKDTKRKSALKNMLRKLFDGN